MMPALTAFLAMILFPVTASPGFAEVSNPELTLGEKIYSERCKVCHGVKGDGQSFAANVLDPPPKNFTSSDSKKELSLKRMMQSVANGRTGTAMMPWKDNLTKEEIRSVVKYIRRKLMRLEN